LAIEEEHPGLKTSTCIQKAGVRPARTVTNAYSYGLLTGVSEGGTSFAPSITYHTNMTPNRITFGNGAWLDHAKDPYDMARPSRITLGNASSSWDTGVYGYDGAGNITTMAGASTDTFVYDRVSRIKEARVTVGGQVKTQSYTYDSFSNVKTITTNGSTRSLAVDTLTNRISGSGYDTAGSMTSWGDGATTYSYAYYQTGQTKQMTGDGRNTVHGYSADGERVGTFDSVVAGITYVLRGLDNKPLRQYLESAGVWTWQKDWVYRDGLLLATIEPSGTRYFHLDHLGTPRRITNSSRTVTASHDYYPFGEEITSGAQDAEVLKFTGHERDLRDASKTTDDLDYMHARYHNPNLARFLTVDPAGGDPKKPQSWNRYSYVRNNPVKATDTDGRALNLLWDIPDIGLGLAAIGKLWVKAAHEPITAADNFDAITSAVGMLPFVTGAAIVGKTPGIVSKLDEAADAARVAENAEDAAAPTSRAARREAMREAGTPTSRPTSSQTGGAGHRQTVVEGPDGTPRVQTQHGADSQHPNPHWHDAQPKIDPATGQPRTNRHGQIKYEGQGSTAVEYKDQ